MPDAHGHPWMARSVAGTGTQPTEDAGEAPRGANATKERHKEAAHSDGKCPFRHFRGSEEPGAAQVGREARTQGRRPVPREVAGRPGGRGRSLRAALEPPAQSCCAGSGLLSGPFRASHVAGGKEELRGEAFWHK